MRKISSKAIALGGMLCGVAMVIMCLVGLIPVATYVCPMLCCLILQIVLCLCGEKISWAWYLAVSILSLLFAPDKEAAMIFVALGYYPVIKPKLEKVHFSWVLKFIIFNVSICVAYAVLIFMMGVEELALGDVGTVLFLILAFMGNLTFFLLDRLLDRIELLIRVKRKKTNG